MSYSLDSQEAQKRIRLIAIMLLIIIIIGSVLFAFLIVVTPEPVQPIDGLEYQGADYVLSCQSTLDGSVNLYLEHCVKGTKSCEIVAEGSYFGLTCTEMRLQMQDGVLYVSSGISLILDYKP